MHVEFGGMAFRLQTPEIERLSETTKACGFNESVIGMKAAARQVMLEFPDYEMVVLSTHNNIHTNPGTYQCS
ncbi:hypothetical protein CBR_g24250 [Chara braunii]|uniref:Uncharacterized protein n=1 Tax=Chara braunii TaxID=69332 RepID=A0A388JM72_CHABU|nr:hypothetical protein CBR_g24250 [Chara braunii]|eukprot:GBG58898.1 hypothetical protein CBR_g24250 [Chara braunii]